MSEETSLALHNLIMALSLIDTRRTDSTTTIKSGSAEYHVDRALQIYESASRAHHDEPVRTIHHFSCTGGTLITKCIAAMSNVIVLNEIDLHSKIPNNSNGPAVFTPSDVISLLRQGDTAVSNKLISKIFLADLAVVREEQWKIGRTVVLRDHSHSHFLMGSDVGKSPTLLNLVQSKFPARSVVTVRNPVDSFASMKLQGWHTMFSPSNFEEYCRRYHKFLDAYDGVPIVKYEDFTARPKGTMRELCKLLDLRYNMNFDKIFSAFKFSGDSGRSSDTIRARPRRHTVQDENIDDLTSSQEYLLKRLGYVQ